MTLTSTHQHKITFTVESFWDTEGGMGHEQFGVECDDIVQAVALLDIANITKRDQQYGEWVIVARAEKIVTGSVKEAKKQ